MTCEQEGFVTIFQGSAKNLLITLEDADGNPVDVSTATEIKALFLPASGSSLLQLKKTDGDITIVNGREQIQVAIDAAFSATMKADENQDFEVEVTMPTAPTVLVWRLRKALTVEARLTV